MNPETSTTNAVGFGSWRPSPAVLPAVGLVVLAVVIPLIGLIVEALDLSSIWSTLSRPSVIDAFEFSLWQAALSTVITLALGSMITWVIARYEFIGRNFVRATLTVPFVLPTVVVAAAFLAVLPTSIERGLTSIVLAHVFFNLAIVIRLVAPVWSVLDQDQIAVARTLGASPGSIVLRIALPVARSALSSAAALVFLMSFSSYGIVRILGGPGSNTIEVEIYRRAVQFGDVSGATVLALVQTVVILGIFAITTRQEAQELPRAETRRRSAPKWASMFALGLTAVCLTPLAVMVVRSVFVGGHWTTSGWKGVVSSSGPIRTDFDLSSVLMRSVMFALLAACIAVPVGIAAATGLTRRSGRWTRLVLVAPMSTSAVVVGFGILVTYDRNPFDFRSSWWLIPVVHAVVALPFVVRSAVPVVQSIPRGLREAAATLGASPSRRWMAVDARLMMPALATGFGLSAALSLGEFGATSFLTRRDSETLPIVIEQLLARSGDTPITSTMAAATILLLLTAALIVTFDSSLRT